MSVKNDDFAACCMGGKGRETRTLDIAKYVQSLPSTQKAVTAERPKTLCRCVMPTVGVVLNQVETMSDKWSCNKKLTR